MEKLTEEELNNFVETAKNYNKYTPPKYFMTRGQIERMVEEGLPLPIFLTKCRKMSL